MEMEQLTKQQIVLLCLLVCFVSSIATGSVIVSLVDQASPAISQTVNHVIERVVEHDTASSTPATSTTQSAKDTVIVTDDQATISAIALASKSVVRISGASTGIGVIISPFGRIVATLGDGAVVGQSLMVHLAGGNVVPASFLSTDSATGLSILQAEQSSNPNDLQNGRAYTPAHLTNSDSLQLGQAVVSIGGLDTAVVSNGIVSSLPPKQIVVESSRAANFDSGAVLVTLLGEIVGIGNSASFTPSNIIKTYATP